MLFGTEGYAEKFRKLTASCMTEYTEWFTVTFKSVTDPDLYKYILTCSGVRYIDDEGTLRNKIRARGRRIKQNKEWSELLDITFLIGALDLPMKVILPGHNLNDSVSGNDGSINANPPEFVEDGKTLIISPSTTCYQKPTVVISHTTMGNAKRDSKSSSKNHYVPCTESIDKVSHYF